MVVTPKKHVSLNQGGSPGLRDVMSSLASRCDSYSADSTTEIMARPSANLRIKDFFKFFIENPFYGEKKQGILSKDAWKSNQIWAKHLQDHIV